MEDQTLDGVIAALDYLCGSKKNVSLFPLGNSCVLGKLRCVKDATNDQFGNVLFRIEFCAKLQK